MSKPNHETEEDLEESTAEDAQGSVEESPNPESADSNTSEDSDSPHAKLSEERDKLHAQLQRTLADLQNFRKRRAQEMTEVRRTAVEAMTTELLPILDNFHLATTFGTSTGDEAMKSMQDGLEMVRGMLESVLQRNGVEEIPADSARFDPSIHEAVGIDPDPEAEEGVITQILQRGYQIAGKVIRPTRVMVGGAASSENDEA